MNGLILSVCSDIWYNMRKCYSLPLKWELLDHFFAFTFASYLTVLSQILSPKYCLIPPFTIIIVDLYFNYAKNAVLCLKIIYIKYYTFWLVSDAFLHISW